MVKISGVSLLCCVALTGCVVADMDSTNYTSFPYVQAFQKPETPGHTNVQQRREDLYACGVSRRHSLNSWDESFKRNALQQGETIEQLSLRTRKIENCMKSKGYVMLDFAECGPLKKPTGMCN
ncbi:hypothetical protein [Atlantibacter hermannii]|uniref:hypothetical protein n=1 Tax=Atlantibacter hermannii TaxID=565 RepID=UPI0028AD8B95|nr:hypothetical protein [Atlantibacter hermannii]